jgi:hypothetical protein
MSLTPHACCKEEISANAECAIFSRELMRSLSEGVELCASVVKLFGQIQENYLQIHLLLYLCEGMDLLVVPD